MAEWRKLINNCNVGFTRKILYSMLGVTVGGGVVRSPRLSELLLQVSRLTSVSKKNWMKNTSRVGREKDVRSGAFR